MPQSDFVQSVPNQRQDFAKNFYLSFNLIVMHRWFLLKTVCGNLFWDIENGINDVRKRSISYRVLYLFFTRHLLNYTTRCKRFRMAHRYIENWTLKRIMTVLLQLIFTFSQFKKYHKTMIFYHKTIRHSHYDSQSYQN